MKDITIKSDRIKKELLVLLTCFIISFISNLGAIFFYESPLQEAFTSLFYVFIFALILYVVWITVQIIVNLILRFFNK